MTHSIVDVSTALLAVTKFRGLLVDVGRASTLPSVTKADLPGIAPGRDGGKPQVHSAHSLLGLPAELRNLIWSFLPMKDQALARRACRQMSAELARPILLAQGAALARTRQAVRGVIAEGSLNISRQSVERRRRPLVVLGYTIHTQFTDLADARATFFGEWFPPLVDIAVHEGHIGRPVDVTFSAGRSSREATVAFTSANGTTHSEPLSDFVARTLSLTPHETFHLLDGLRFGDEVASQGCRPMAAANVKLLGEIGTELRLQGVAEPDLQLAQERLGHWLKCIEFSAGTDEAKHELLDDSSADDLFFYLNLDRFPEVWAGARYQGHEDAGPTDNPDVLLRAAGLLLDRWADVALSAPNEERNYPVACFWAGANAYRLTGTPLALVVDNALLKGPSADGDGAAAPRAAREYWR